MPFYQLHLVYGDGMRAPHGAPFDDLRACLAELLALEAELASSPAGALASPRYIDVLDDGGRSLITLVPGTSHDPTGSNPPCRLQGPDF